MCGPDDYEFDENLIARNLLKVLNLPGTLKLKQELFILLMVAPSYQAR